MTEHQKNCKRILEFLYEIPELPDELRSNISRWLLAHEDDEAVAETMSSLWNSNFIPEQGVFDPSGLQRLLTEVDLRRRRPLWRSVWRYAAAAVIFVMALTGVYFLGANIGAQDNTVLLVAAGSKGEFILPDSTRVWLNGGTRLCYNGDDFRSDRRHVKVEGEAYFEVTKDASRPFTVEMTQMEVEVLGTCFDVRNYDFSRTEEVVLKEGKVSVVMSGSDEMLYLEPDQRIVLDRSTGNVSLSDENAYNYCSWYQPKVRFEGVALGDILTQISRRYRLVLEVSPQVNTDILLTLTVYNDDADEVMRAIAYLADLSYTISDNTLNVR